MLINFTSREPKCTGKHRYKAKQIEKRLPVSHASSQAPGFLHVCAWVNVLACALIAHEGPKLNISQLAIEVRVKNVYLCLE